MAWQRSRPPECVREQELGEQSCGAVKVLAVGDEQHELTLEFQALNGNDL